MTGNTTTIVKRYASDSDRNLAAEDLVDTAGATLTRAADILETSPFQGAAERAAWLREAAAFYTTRSKL